MMRQKVFTGLLALVFVGGLFLMTTSCAKKQVQVSEPTMSEADQAAAEKAWQESERMRKQKLAAEEEQARRQVEEYERRKQYQTEEMASDQFSKFESENIYFDFDRSDLKHYSQVILKEKAEFLRNNSSYSLWIEGHCDERGTNEYNLALGERRAHAAKKFLESLGISSSRIKTISYGEERPADPRHNEEAWGKNRRDEFKLID